MGGIMVEGNGLLAGSALTFNGHTYTKNDVSAATQVAIWTVEYGSLTYSITGSSLSSSDFADLVSYLTTNAGNANWLLLDASAYGESQLVSKKPLTYTYTYDQNLGTILHTPGPVAGTGLPFVVLAGLGLLLLWRRQAMRAVANA
jgi:hypothetical protein